MVEHAGLLRAQAFLVVFVDDFVIPRLAAFALVCATQHAAAGSGIIPGAVAERVSDGVIGNSPLAY